jgi:hypothetical protein
VVFPLVPKLQLGNGLIEAGASAQLCSQAPAWEQEAKDLHPIHNIFMLRCDPTGSWGLLRYSVPSHRRTGPFRGGCEPAGGGRRIFDSHPSRLVPCLTGKIGLLYGFDLLARIFSYEPKLEE